jgi:hypothetical protein
LQVISFCIVLSLVLAFVFQRCWNRLAQDFRAMPPLSYRNSVGVIIVASLFCGLILTMISGARELMTPGAWKKVGTHYELVDPKTAPTPIPDHIRKRGMEQFRDALWQHARAHDGSLPEDPFRGGLPETFWRSPDETGTPYGYILRGTKKVASLIPSESTTMPSQDSGTYVLAYEPKTFGDTRYVLFSSGAVVKMTAKELFACVDGDAVIGQPPPAPAQASTATKP